MNQHLTLNDTDHQTMAKEEVMNRDRDTKKTVIDQLQEPIIKPLDPNFLYNTDSPETIIEHEAMDPKLIQYMPRPGWHIAGQYGRGHRSFAYTVGLYKSFDQPELFVIGLPQGILMPRMLDNIVDLMKTGVKIEHGTESDQILKGYRCTFGQTRMNCFQEYFHLGKRRYRRSYVPMLQCVYPDREGRYPWQPGSSYDFRLQQPVLSLRSAGMEMFFRLAATKTARTSN